MGDTGRHRYGVAPPGQQRHPAGTRPPSREAPRLRATDARSRRLMLGVVTPLILAATVAVAVGETADFLVRAHVSGADAAADPRRHVSKRGMFSTVAASGETVVAVGLQDSVTPSFRVSADGGLTWTPAVVRSQAGPVAGHQATLVASGPGGWVGLGPHAIWISSNGTTWTLISARGLAAPGETITGVTKDSWGYLATGTSTRSGTGLVWTSPNGLTWHRFTAAQFGLADDPGEQVFAMTDAATNWSVTLIAGSATKGGKTCAYVWRSLDDGASWRTVVIPQTQGAGWSFTGLAGEAGHFIAVRPGVTPSGTADAVVYTSDDAINWHFAATINSSAGFTPRQVTADTSRFVITGRDQEGRAVAYTSTDNGAAWTQSDGFGVLPSA
jgi:hypothetical protein